VAGLMHLSVACDPGKIAVISCDTPLQAGSPATARFILNPFPSGGLTRLFSTPPKGARVRRLHAMHGTPH
jgi:hypothetical protein